VNIEQGSMLYLDDKNWSTSEVILRQ